jgi:hypothetical protein
MMNKPLPFSPDLIAPCGMNCAICSRHLSYVNNLNKSQCTGCRPRNKKCSYLFGKCTGINHKAKSDAAFCFTCNQFPCKQIDRIDRRYKTNYKMSMKENLGFIKTKGILKFIINQYEKYACQKCGGLISIHNRKCFKCHTITKLIEKQF